MQHAVKLPTTIWIHLVRQVYSQLAGAFHFGGQALPSNLMLLRQCMVPATPSASAGQHIQAMAPWLKQQPRDHLTGPSGIQPAPWRPCPPRAGTVGEFFKVCAPACRAAVKSPVVRTVAPASCREASAFGRNSGDQNLSDISRESWQWTKQVPESD